MVLLILAGIGLGSCSTKVEQPATTVENSEFTSIGSKPNVPLFSLLSVAESGVTFVNDLGKDNRINPYRYINAFNGGGVAVGDINNDGLYDLYFTGNLHNNGLFLNKGNLQFEDITETAGVGGGMGWCSGVTMADVNADGWMDIYVCKEFHSDADNRRENLLYINNKDNTFTDYAPRVGVNDKNLSVQATFFDYDLDGDLDLYVANHPWTYNLDFDYNQQQQRNPQLEDSDRLYRNDGQGFTEVTREAGILNFGFSLGIVASDFDKDGWPDVYIANDHAGPDRFWHNNGDGTFTNIVNEAMMHTCNFSMGMDASDFNNDGWLDIVNVDMVAADNFRQKSMMSGMNPKGFWRSVDAGYHFQYMRNVLQVNNGNGTFSDIARMTGMSNTDWSWTALFADFNNSGRKDLFITNGYRLDARSNDFLLQRSAEIERRKNLGLPPLMLGEWGDQMYDKLSATPLSNYYFENNGGYDFTSKAAAVGLGKPGFSHGAAYADLDNDGDLDLVINNTDEVAHIYRNNNSEQQAGHNAVWFQFVGDNANRNGLGTKVTIKTGDQIQFQEVAITRGFQSAVPPAAHFGIGTATRIDEVVIEWPDGRSQVLTDPPLNRLILVNQADAKKQRIDWPEPDILFSELVNANGAAFTHKENEYNDYDREVLLPHKMSQFGPNFAVGDINADGLDDFYVGGAAGQPGELFLGTADGAFKKTASIDRSHAKYEDLGACFFDADGDGDLDLYVASGGNSMPAGSALLQDRLYLNDGKGRFTYAPDAVPKITGSGSCVVPGDYDGDGDLDLFVGGRLEPGHYPYPAQSYILQNAGGTFTDATMEVAAEIGKIGLVTTALWLDFDNDQQLDLILAGEWMPISFFRNNAGVLQNVTESKGFADFTGWWNDLSAADFDGDGDLDIIAGNLGLNYKYHASPEQPFPIYAKDFDNNGSDDIVLGYYNNGTCFPLRGRQCSSEQIPEIKEKFPSYNAFAAATIEDVYGADLKNALHYEATTFANYYLENKGDGTFARHKLPNRAQFAPINASVAHDWNGDGNMDVLMAGNLFVSEVETGRADGGTGLLLLGDGGGNFKPVAPLESGFFANGDVKDLAVVQSTGGDVLILVANNNAPIQVFFHHNKSGALGMR